jgi:hypothetical protein
MWCGLVVLLYWAPAAIDVTGATAAVPTLPEAVHGLDGSRREDERRVRYLRLTLETAALMALPALGYWTHPGAQEQDWDLKFDWHSWQRKLDLDAVRFDGNRFETNMIMHPLSGTAYYQVARDNGLGLFQSYLSAFIASFLWEYMIEFRELPSLNDIILTPAAGVALGEPSHRLSRWLASRPPTLANRVGAFILSPIASINDAIWGQRPSPSADAGYPSLWLSIGGLSTALEGQGRREELSLAVDASLVAHHGYREPGQASEAVAPGAWSGLSARVLLDRATGPSGVGVRAETLFLGHYLRSYAPDRGAGLMLGLGGSFDFDSRSLGAKWDRVGSVGLIGPMTELTVDRPGLSLSLSLSAAYSFAMVESLAYALHGDALGASVIRTSLRGAGYYFGHGLTSTANLRLRVAFVEAELAGDLGLFRSIQGRDRFQERLDSDFSLSDLRADGSALVSAPLTRGLRLGGRYERILRHSQLLRRTATADETRLELLLAFSM